MFFCQDLVAIHVNEDDLPAVAVCDRFLLETMVNGKTDAAEKSLPDNDIIFVVSKGVQTDITELGALSCTSACAGGHSQ